MIDEAERSLHDALAVLSQTVKETRTVLGGGCAEMLMANAVDDIVKTTEGKTALAIESFAQALRQVRIFGRYFFKLLVTKDSYSYLPFWRTMPVTTLQI